MSPLVKLLFVFIVALIASIAAQESYQTAAVTAHNQYRAKHHDTEGVDYDADLAHAAEECAEMYVKGTAQVHQCPHIKNKNYGENWGWVGGSTFDGAMAQIMKLWYDEIKNYNFDNPNSNDYQRTGHFTQVVWKETKRVGCGCAEDNNHGIHCSCAYAPAGNVNIPKSYGASVGETD